jgi:chromate transporter
MSTAATPIAEAAASTAASAAVSFSEAFHFWLKLGFISFGGPAGQIAIMHTELVERRRWISERRFLHALNYCMLLPGPEAQQLATHIGWLMHRTWGASWPARCSCCPMCTRARLKPTNGSAARR